MRSLTIIFLSACLLTNVSCNNENRSSQEYLTNEAPAPSTEEQIAAQKAYEDSIRIAEAHKLERKNANISKLTGYISEFTSEYALRNAKNTKQDVTYEIINTDYNELTESLSITFKSVWWACVEGMFCDNKEEHIFTGKISLIASTGELLLEPIEKNSVLKRSESYNNSWNDFSQWVDEQSSKQ